MKILKLEHGAGCNLIHWFLYFNEYLQNFDILNSGDVNKITEDLNTLYSRILIDK